ncbi:MAG: hypothetical protein KDJ44_11350 [Rhodoblastus sp.]|nr:hypothetical protein [Rhodoblastus sp.]
MLVNAHSRLDLRHGGLETPYRIARLFEQSGIFERERGVGAAGLEKCDLVMFVISSVAFRDIENARTRPSS